MNAAPGMPIRFQLGARSLFAVRRRLVRVPLSLADVLAGTAPALPSLPRGADGHAITSLPATLLPRIGTDGTIAFVRQSYTRYHADLTTGFDAWFASLSANARSGLKRKAKRLTAASGGTLDIRRYRTADEVRTFHREARTVAARTYQERLLGSALPEDLAFVTRMVALAEADAVRAWLLYLDARPIAYLYCPVIGRDLLYEYVGHDPATSDFSPGAVLQMEAMRDLFAEDRFDRFDFTEGEGQHKRQMATAGTPCVDLLLLRPTLANRALIAALRAFDGGVALAKHAATAPALAGIARRVRRGAPA